jgi:hypothetical protein
MLVALLVPAAARADSAPSPAAAVDELNVWRALVGVEPVTLDDGLSAGCRNHASYLRVNPLARGHAESTSAPGYSAAGDLAARTSVLAYGPGPVTGPEVWEPTPYHRMALLDPRLSTTGFWSEFGLTCMNVDSLDDERRSPELVAYPYPFSGQRGVATTFGCNESPDPCLAVPGNDGTRSTGFEISVQFNGPWTAISEVRVADASLRPANGAPVKLTVDTTDSELRGGVLLIPSAPLAAGTTYSAAVSGTVVGRADDGTTTDHPYGLTWDFSTPGITPAASLKVVVQRVTRSNIRLRLDLVSGEARRARISLLNDRTPLLRVIRELRGSSQTVVLQRPRARVTTIAVLLRGSATQTGVAARLRTSIRSRR